MDIKAKVENYLAPLTDQTDKLVELLSTDANVRNLLHVLEDIERQLDSSSVVPVLIEEARVYLDGIKDKVPDELKVYMEKLIETKFGGAFSGIAIEDSSNDYSDEGDDGGGGGMNQNKMSSIMDQQSSERGQGQEGNINNNKNNNNNNNNNNNIINNNNDGNDGNDISPAQPSEESSLEGKNTPLTEKDYDKIYPDSSGLSNQIINPITGLTSENVLENKVINYHSYSDTYFLLNSI